MTEAQRPASGSGGAGEAGGAGGSGGAGGGAGPDPASFLSGSSGSPGGRAARLARRAVDRLLDVQLRRAAGRLDELAGAAPERDVLVLSVYRGDGGLLPRAIRELRDSRHRVRLALGSMEAAAPGLADDTVAEHLPGGKFENLNAILAAIFMGSDPLKIEEPASDAGSQILMGSDPIKMADWTLVVDDDVLVPDRFVDRLIGVAEHFELALAQPAQSLVSHAAWPVTRRRRGALLRQSRFVEIGPVTLFRRDALAELTPFPPLRYGWGLDLHWAALAEDRGWRLGIVDALPVRHERAEVAGTYSSKEAIAEAQSFLAERPFLDSESVLQSRPLR